MFRTQEAVAEQEFRIIDAYHSLLKEWLDDLDFQEKLVWLWNAKAEMVRIKQRRR